jgi:hypothetical protein
LLIRERVLERLSEGGHMSRKPRPSLRSTHRRRIITLGDLISAAYDAAPGLGRARLERAMAILTRSPLARHLSPHVEFVR